MPYKVRTRPTNKQKAEIDEDENLTNKQLFDAPNPNYEQIKEDDIEDVIDTHEKKSPNSKYNWEKVKRKLKKVKNDLIKNITP